MMLLTEINEQQNCYLSAFDSKKSAKYGKRRRPQFLASVISDAGLQEQYKTTSKSKILRLRSDVNNCYAAKLFESVELILSFESNTTWYTAICSPFATFQVLLCSSILFSLVQSEEAKTWLLRLEET